MICITTGSNHSMAAVKLTRTTKMYRVSKGERWTSWQWFVRRKSNGTNIIQTILFNYLLLCLVINVSSAGTESRSSQITCPIQHSVVNLAKSDRMNVTYMEPQADVFFTVLLPQLNCETMNSAEQRDTLIYIAAIRHALNLLNNGAEPSTMMHFFPLLHRFPSWPSPIKYGAKIIYVSKQASFTNLAQFNLMCQQLDANYVQQQQQRSVIQDLAILDGVQLVDKQRDNEIVANIPTISLSPKESIVTTLFKANLIVNLLDALDWKHFALITTRHEDSLYIVKILGQIAHSGHICISDIFEWPSKGVLTQPEVNEQKSVNNNNLAAFFKSIARKGSKIPILVLSNDEQHVAQLVTTLHATYTEQLRNHQLFFSLVPSPELFEQLQKLSKWCKVFTLSSQLPQFNIDHSVMESCHKSTEVGNANAMLNNDMWNRWLAFLPIRSMLSVSIALNSALQDICVNKQQNKERNITNLDTNKLWCSEFDHLDRKTFFKYLNNLESQIESTLMSFGTINKLGDLNDLLLFDGHEFQTLKSNYSFDASNCLNSDCSSCVKFRQSRENDEQPLDSNEYEEKMYGREQHHNMGVLLNEEESAQPMEETDDLGPVLHVETHEIYLGLMLPLHRMGGSILECSSELNLSAYYLYKAALWIVNKINQNNYLIPGIEIKLELIDTCSSPFYAAQELAQLTSSEAKVQPIAFVSSLPRDHYRQVVDFVSSINYTLISTQDISFMDFKVGPQYGILQTAVTSHNLVKALVEQLKYFGWRYVSIVVDEDDPVSMAFFHYLQELTANEKICFASVEQLSEQTVNGTLGHLLENHKNGASVVILLTNLVSTSMLMANYQSWIKQNLVHNENLHFLVVRDQNLEMVQGFEEEFLGSIFVRESIGRMNHFDNHFLNLIANPPKDPLLYKFIDQCGRNSVHCLRVVNSFDRTVAANTMQAILAIVGGFARMRNETCANEQGICNKMLESNFHRNLLSYILNTRSMRIDTQYDYRFKSDHFDIFEFAPDGSSGRDIELLNFKHDLSNGLFRFDTAALYVHSANSFIRNPYVRYSFYKYNGLINNHKEFNETELITSDCNNLKNCHQCEPQTPEFIYMPSWDELLITGVFDVHLHSSQNPLICQKNYTLLESVQKVEAFLWTLEQINNDQKILPGIHLGALLFDTCSSYQKTYRDVSNFLSNSLLLGENVHMPTANSVIGFVVDGHNPKIIDSIMDLANPLKISVLASETREAKYNDSKHYPQFLGYSLPNSLYMEAVLNIMKKYSWSYVSVLYENNLEMHRYHDAFNYLERNSARYGVQFAVKEIFDESNIETNIEHLKSAAKSGSRVLISLVSQDNLAKFLSHNSALKRSKRLLAHEIVLVIIDSQAIVDNFSHLNMSIISISQDIKLVPEFKEHFLDLSLQSNLKNPWFGKLWEKAFHCQGFACYRINGNLRGRQVTVSAGTTAVIEAVYSLALGLELIRKNLCPNAYTGLCPKFHEKMGQISKLESEMIRQNAFIGLDNSRIAFNANSNYIDGHLNIFNWQQPVVEKASTTSSTNNKQWLYVGRFDAYNGLAMSSSKTNAYTAEGVTGNFFNILSKCNQSGGNNCQQQQENNNQQFVGSLPPTLSGGGASASVNNAPLYIALVLPLHDVRFDGKCGQLNTDMFERLIAFKYALAQHNRNLSSSTSSTIIDVLVFDVCNYSKQQFISIENSGLLLKIVAVISFGETNQLTKTVNRQLSGAINSYNPFVYDLHSVRAEEQQQQQSFFFQEHSTRSDENSNQVLRSIVDLCLRNKWLVVNLVYSNEFSKDYFLFEANQKGICVDQMIVVKTKDIAKLKFKDEWNRFTSSLDTQVLIVLTGVDMVEYLIRYSDKHALDDLIWIGDDALKTGSINAEKSVKKLLHSKLIVKKLSDDERTHNGNQSVTMIEVAKQLVPSSSSSSELSENKPMLAWLADYWNRKYSCSLNHTTPQISACAKLDKIPRTFFDSKELRHIIDFTQVLRDSLMKFVQQKCDTPKTLNEACIGNMHLRRELTNSIIDNLNRKNLLGDSLKTNSEWIYHVELSTNYGNMLNIFNSFNWRNVSNDLLLRNGRLLNTVCQTSCEHCNTQLKQSKNQSTALLFESSIQSPLTSTTSMHRNWAIGSSIFSTLGLIVVLICVLYFILIFPLALGTTIIGYQILIGLFFCYLINFAFLLPSNASLCWVRQFALPITYMVIVSGLLVKAFNYWCQICMKQNNTKPMMIMFNSPTSLLTISGACIALQVVIAVFFTYKHSSNAMAFSNTSFQCDIFNKFSLLHADTIWPLAPLAIFLVIIIFLTIKTIDNLESRWILTCTALTAFIWITWMGFDAVYYRQFKSISIVVANSLNASVFILLLYIRKLYLFSKISRKILKERRLNMDANMQYEPFADYQQQYGAFRTCTDNVSWNSSHKANHHRNATRSPFEADNEDNISSCGSVKSNTSQVQCQELYPMEVYDNQLSQSNARIGQSTRSIYDIIDDANLK